MNKEAIVTKREENGKKIAVLAFGEDLLTPLTDTTRPIVTDLVKKEGYTNIVLDFSTVIRIDSGGARLLTMINNLCVGNLGTMVVVGIQKHVQDLLKGFRFETVLTTKATVDEAIAYIATEA
jgi:anti-anti-sigma factor